MPSEPTAPRSPEPLFAGDHMVHWFTLAILAIVGGIAILALEPTAIGLAAALAITIAVVAVATVAIFRLVAHEGDGSAQTG
jgi:hypothetical protein